MKASCSSPATARQQPPRLSTGARQRRVAAAAAPSAQVNRKKERKKGRKRELPTSTTNRKTMTRSKRPLLLHLSQSDRQFEWMVGKKKQGPLDPRALFLKTRTRERGNECAMMEQELRAQNKTLALDLDLDLDLRFFLSLCSLLPCRRRCCSFFGKREPAEAAAIVILNSKKSTENSSPRKATKTKTFTHSTKKNKTRKIRTQPQQNSKKQITPARIAVLGASGYTGEEVVRLAAGHPGLDLVALTGDSQAGKPYSEVYPHLAAVTKGLAPLTKIADVDWSQIDAAFCCLPHATTQETLAKLPTNVKIVDLSADFRLRNVETYKEW